MNYGTPKAEFRIHHISAEMFQNPIEAAGLLADVCETIQHFGIIALPDSTTNITGAIFVFQHSTDIEDEEFQELLYHFAIESRYKVKRFVPAGLLYDERPKWEIPEIQKFALMLAEKFPGFLEDEGFDVETRKRLAFAEVCGLGGSVDFVEPESLGAQIMSFQDFAQRVMFALTPPPCGVRYNLAAFLSEIGLPMPTISTVN